MNRLLLQKQIHAKKSLLFRRRARAETDPLRREIYLLRARLERARAAQLTPMEGSR